MRILVIHHGHRSPATGPTSGGALRATQIGQGLQLAGHEVHFLCRAQDQSGGYLDDHDLLQRCKSLSPDRIICIQLEEASTLRQVGVPMAVDLFAMRLLEAPFSNDLHHVSAQCLQALSAGDAFLLSNHRQKWTWLGVLAMVGIDIRQDPTLLVPLAARIHPERHIPEELTLIGGGVWWPWQNPWPALERAVKHLDKRGTGTIIWYGSGSKTPPINHPRLQLPGWQNYEQFRHQLSQSSAAFDWLESNPERQLAMAFRHLDYLGCGLGIATYPDSPLGDVLGTAGWASEHIEKTIDQLLDTPQEISKKSKAAHRLAKKFSVQETIKPLLHWIETASCRQPPDSPLLQAGHALSQAMKAADTIAHQQVIIENQHAEIQQKRQEVAELQTNLQQHVTIIDRLSRAVDEVAGFKREATQILGQRVDHASRSAEETRRENAILRADLEKKSAELQAMDQLRERLENDIQNLREELQRRPSGIFGRKR